MRLTTALLLAACATAAAAPQGQGEKKEGVSLRLVFPVKEYAPAKPAEGMVKCLVRNDTAEAVTVPGLGGPPRAGTRLLGAGKEGRWALWLWVKEPGREEYKGVRVKPGAEEVLFELPLKELLRGRARDARIGWTWDARPAPPASPIHMIRDRGYQPEATFWAETYLDKKQITSPKVLLKVKAP